MPPRGAVIIVPMLTGQRVQLSATSTILAGIVRIRARCAVTSRTINFGDQFNDMDVLSDGDAIVMTHPYGVDLSTWYGAGTTGDELHIIHGGGF